MCDRITYLDLFAGLDARDDVAYVTRVDPISRHHVKLEYAHLIGVVLHACIDELDLVSLGYGAIDNLIVGDDATEGVEDGVKDERLKRSLRVAHRGWHTLYDGIKDLVDTLSRLTTGKEHFVWIYSQQADDLVLHLFGRSTGQVDLVDHRYDRQVMLDRHVEVADGLRLYPLRSVYDEQRSLTCSYGARHLVAEVHVSWRVNQIERVLHIILSIGHLYGVALDRDATLTL